MNKLNALEAIYRFYDSFLDGFPLVCKKGCSTCCTTDVTLTSLEAEYFVPLITDEQKEKIKKVAHIEHYIPNTTINTSASFYLSRKEPPEDTSQRGKGTCPLLSDHGLCTIYDKRPFACRAMSSEEICQESGQARMAPFLVTINLAIYQILEHIDSQGCYGNLLDIVCLLCETKDRNDRIKAIKSYEGIIKTNRELPCFFIPPEETIRFKSFMRRLSKEPVGDNLTLADFLPEKWQILS